jgi:hypothetical protein
MSWLKVFSQIYSCLLKILRSSSRLLNRSFDEFRGSELDEVTNGRAFESIVDFPFY